MKYVILLLLLPICMACTEKSRCYTDFVIHQDTLWRLDFKGHIFPVDLKTNQEILHPLLNWDNAIAITCDNVGHLITCDNNNNIKRISLAQNTLDQLYTCPGIVTGITCDRQNNIYIITQSGIVDLNSQHTYAPDTFAIPLPWKRRPQFIMDQEDNIWLGFNMDGQRGDVYIFNTKDKIFFQPDFGNLDMAHQPIVSLFTGNSSREVYGTSTYINGDVITNNLIQFYQHTGKVLTDTSEDIKLKTGVCYKDQIYIGNSLGGITKWVKGKWSVVVPAGNKIIDKIYADDRTLIYLTRDGKLNFKNL